MNKLAKRKNPLNRVFFNQLLVFLFIFLLPTQFGKHFFFDFSYLSGVRVDYLAPTLYVTDCIVLLLTLINITFVLSLFKNKKILVLFSVFIVTTFFALSKPLAVYSTVKVLEFVIVFFFMRKKIVSTKSLLIAFFLGLFLQFFLAVMQLINKHSLQGIFYFLGERYLSLSSPNVAKASVNGVEILRPYGTFSHPNSLAGFYLLLYFFVLTIKRNISPLFKNILLFLTAFLTFVSFSKLAISSFVLLNLVFYLKDSGSKKICWPCFVSRTITFLVVGLLFFLAKTDPLSLAKRIELLRNSLTIIASHPLFGVGPGNYLVAQNTLPSRFTTFINQPVHNVFLLFMSEVGLIGIIICVSVFFKPLRQFIKKNPFVFMVIVLTGFFDHYWLTLQQNMLLFATILGSL